MTINSSDINSCDRCCIVTNSFNTCTWCCFRIRFNIYSDSKWCTFTSSCTVRCDSINHSYSSVSFILIYIGCNIVSIVRNSCLRICIASCISKISREWNRRCNSYIHFIHGRSICILRNQAANCCIVTNSLCWHI